MAISTSSVPLVETRDLSVHFATGGKAVRAVDGVSLSVFQNEILAVVGESGSGKSTLGMAILGLYKATTGVVLFNGNDVTQLNSSELRVFRGDFQIVFQDPTSSLDPRMKVKDLVAEPLRAVNRAKRNEIHNMIIKILELVGLQPTDVDRFPHEFSGGEKQRICIARAIVTTPKFVVLDEPTSALDVSVQAQILNLLKTLQKEFRMSYLLITHNISVAKYVSDRIVVMYGGKIVEVGDARTVMEHPKHPYTVGLIGSIAELGKPKGSIRGLSGEPPSPTSPPPGCRFHPRCSMAQEICRVQDPALRSVSAGHSSACHFAEEVQLWA